MSFFHDLEQKWPPKVEALFGASMENEGERKATWGRGRERASTIFLLSEERESCFLVFKGFFLFSYYFIQAMPHVSIWVEQEGPTFSFDCDPYSATKVRKIWPLKRQNPTLVCVPFLWFQFLAFLCVRHGQFSKVTNVYIKTLRIKPRAWFRGWFC